MMGGGGGSLKGMPSDNVAPARQWNLKPDDSVMVMYAEF